MGTHGGAGGEGLTEKVGAWLEESGRALELRVARALIHGGADDVEQSFSYVDPEMDKRREGDVKAHFRWVGLNGVPCVVVAVTECKSGTGKPWVAMLDQTRVTAGELKEWAAYAHGPFTAITDPLSSLWVGREPFNDARLASHVVTALSNDDGRGNKANPANDAIRQVMSATAAARLDYISGHHTNRRGFVALPVVVINAPLFTCELDEDGEVRLLEVQSCTVRASAKGMESARVYVIREGQVPRFAAALAELARLAGQEARGAS